MKLEYLKKVASGKKTNYQTFEYIQVSMEHFARLVEIADAALEFARGDSSSFRLREALIALEDE